MAALPTPRNSHAIDGRELRYLGGRDVDACLPPLGRQLELAAEALTALASGDAEMPPKVGVHPRPGALLHAMPAWVRTADLVGVKWVSAFPGNAGRGLPAIDGLIVLNDPDSGLPTCLMDGARITAARTAAVTGVAVRLFAPRGTRRVAILGGGVQARSHIPVVGFVLPGSEIAVYDRHRDRAEAVAAWADGQAGISAANAVSSALEAVAGAQLVVTVAALGSSSQAMRADWLDPAALVVAVDFATYVSAEVARAAAVFVVDDRAQFLAYRDAGYFEGYPDPTETLGEALTASGAQRRRERGTAVVTHLGIGIADIIFAHEVRRSAEARSIGITLPR
ncbi:MAG: hypothetical protein M3301_00735 [Chloroflexota bacterium]|nr:hypothetical protein [Chloroflexota bacterium]